MNAAFATTSNRLSYAAHQVGKYEPKLEAEKFAEAFGLSAADGDFSLLAIVHTELV